MTGTPMAPEGAYLLLVRWHSGSYVEIVATVLAIGEHGILVRDEQNARYELSRDQVLHWSSPEPQPAFDDPTPHCLLGVRYEWSHAGPDGYTTTTTGRLAYKGSAAVVVDLPGEGGPTAIDRGSIYFARPAGQSELPAAVACGRPATWMVFAALPAAEGKRYAQPIALFYACDKDKARAGDDVVEAGFLAYNAPLVEAPSGRKACGDAVNIPPAGCDELPDLLARLNLPDGGGS